MPTQSNHVPQIPQILKKRLVFGDIEQIKAFQKLEAEADNFFGDSNQKEYRVLIEVEYSKTVIISAGSPREAEAKAQEDFDICSLDCKICFYAKEA
jgi:hypothetical protein